MVLNDAPNSLRFLVANFGAVVDFSEVREYDARFCGAHVTWTMSLLNSHLTKKWKYWVDAGNIDETLWNGHGR